MLENTSFIGSIHYLDEGDKETDQTAIRTADELRSAILERGKTRLRIAGNYSGADLSGLDLSGCDLNNIHLKDASLADANLTGANL